MCKFNSETFVLADIPGLIEGASEGIGLGHYFLRHIERTRLLLHVIDVSGSEERDPFEDFLTVNKELEKYGESVSHLPQIVVLNKTDLVLEQSQISDFKKKLKKYNPNYETVEISAVSNKNLDTLLEKVVKKLQELPKKQKLEFDPFVYTRPDPNRYEIKRASDGAYEVVGGFIDELARGVDLDDFQSFSYFQKVLKDKGIIKELKKRGADENSTIRIKDIDFELREDD